MLAEATAGRGGEFVIIPDALAPGDHELTLATGGGRVGALQPDCRERGAAAKSNRRRAGAAPAPTAAGKVAGRAGVRRGEIRRGRTGRAASSSRAPPRPTPPSGSI